MPEILLLVHRVPYPPNRGDRIRSYHLLKFLAEKGSVSLATLADEPLPPADREHLERLCCRVAIESVGGAGRWLRATTSLLRGRSATEGLFESPALRNTIRAWAREIKFDSVVVFCSSMGPYSGLAELGGAQLLVDFVDVDSQKWFDYAARAAPPNRWLYALEGRRVRKLERSLTDRAAAVVLASEYEADVLRSFHETRRAIGILNGVDLDYFSSSAMSGANAEIKQNALSLTPSLCCFIGVLDYRANVEGLRWFCSEIWPHVRQQVPGAIFRIVGRRPVPSVLRLQDVPGVEVVGEVADVRPYLAASELAVAPLPVARGIQNKVLEAMAMGMAVIATPQALEGLRLETGVHAYSAFMPSEWVTAILSLHGDAVKRRQVGAAARAFVEQHHNWQQCLSPWSDLLAMGRPQQVGVATGARSVPIVEERVAPKDLVGRPRQSTV